MSDQTLRDLADDIDELRALAAGADRRLAAFGERIADDIVSPATRDLLRRHTDDLRAAYRTVRDELAAPSHEVDALHERKDRIADTLRTLQGVTAAALAAADWQSPSFAHTLRSMAGTQTGRIDATITDYKRDVHLDAVAYEHAFRRAFVDAPLQFPPKAYVTTSGMAAFATVVTCLASGGAAKGAVLAGKGCYFENKDILERFFHGRVHPVDEMDTRAVIAAVDALRPSVIFLDSLCNTEDVAVPDLAVLLPAIEARCRARTTLVLDNTGLGPSFQPLCHLRRTSPLQLIVVESLNKFHQYGFDRVTGGIMWRNGMTPLALYACRQHLGTIMPDASVLALPAPDRALLARRMARIDRNAATLAAALDAHIRSQKRSALSHVVHPSLPSYRGAAWTNALPFRGGFFTIAFKTPFARPLFYTRFVSVVLDEAKRAGLQLTSGTSFGFSTTRIYLTALHAKKRAKPFVRVSVGTESAAQMEQLVEVFRRAADRMAFPV
ncbi:PLP-dependent transferase [Candidatus Uhrbacteria bacterium]|nr:PLP-dependent transferase [Candidatus Uhrbacteria bacterium]